MERSNFTLRQQSRSLSKFAAAVSLLNCLASPAMLSSFPALTAHSLSEHEFLAEKSLQTNTSNRHFSTACYNRGSFHAVAESRQSIVKVTVWMFLSADRNSTGATTMYSRLWESTVKRCRVPGGQMLPGSIF
jgi:hypothetical protein